MIRTGVVDLTVIPAVAYRQKLPAGGSGIVILSEKFSQPAIASISKTSGECIPTENTPKDFPKEAFAEALSLTAGMPYRKLGGVKFIDSKPEEVPETPEEKAETLPEAVIVDSAEYQAVVDKYTDKNDRLSYELLNKDLIKFAHESNAVKTMISNMASEKEIALFAAGAKFRDITGNKDLTDEQVRKILDMLDEVSVKGVLREFNDEIRLKLKASKRK